MDIKGESDATKKLYGLDAKYPHTQTFGRQCLIAPAHRTGRAVYRIDLSACGADRWDQHSGLKRGHEDNARRSTTDRRVIKDLKSRGLLKETLVIWAANLAARRWPRAATAATIIRSASRSGWQAAA